MGLHMVSFLVQVSKRVSRVHRGRLDIIADMLKASHGGVKKTYLMYHCNLSFRQLKQYLDFMLRKELLCEVDSNDGAVLSLFDVTAKGKEFIRAYSSLRSLMK